MFGILENYHCCRFHGSGVIVAPHIIGLIFFCTGMQHEYFWGRQCAFAFPIYVRKCRKYAIDRWMVVYTVCAFAVRSVVDSGWIPTLKLVWKCGTRSSILFICNTCCCRLILLSSLYIELALVCCTNPDNVHCFGTIFPNLNFVLPQFVPSARCIFNPTNTEVAQLSTTWPGDDARWELQAFIPMGCNQKQRCGFEFAK